ncbi:15570_t:CDS:1, partial [Rhizophagus irregularis]
ATISPEIIIYKINEDNVSLEKYKPNSESSKVTIDVNNDLNINNSLILNTMPNLNTMSNLNAISNTTSLSINVYESSNNVIYESSTSSQNYLDSSSICIRSIISKPN